ncbi:chromosome segregation protein ParM (plasmid) [Photobacterium sp. CCB-ST2H9]|uniref:chromosome segregation protein ParM n=1 Tax=Photobacterium sp. CCB-ST2H9 TaxID=2912855 RepID=UPI0020C64FAF|nr:chromosome segregation protein ParM [Photobacterium sp. CCB-ST2H9]UTM60478.1 chromosome segregation protein ParM [Photobacterium sp. CCB-ST2H9]
MRISSPQKDALFVLLLIEEKGENDPFPATDLLMTVNKIRPWNKQVDASNFTRSCHKLAENGFVHRFRHPQSLRLAFKLTDLGRPVAEKRRAEWQRELKKDQ